MMKIWSHISISLQITDDDTNTKSANEHSLGMQFYIKNIRISQFSSSFLTYIDKMLLQLQSSSLSGTSSNAYLISRWRLLTHSSYTELTHLQFLKVSRSVKLRWLGVEKRRLHSNIMRKSETKCWQFLLIKHWIIKHIQVALMSQQKTIHEFTKHYGLWLLWFNSNKSEK